MDPALSDIEHALSTCVTPFYLFDEVVVAARIAHLREALPAGVRVCYAMKANPFIMEVAGTEADLIEVCSPGELAICRATDVPDEKLVISGVYKDPALMRELITSHAPIHRYTAESIAQFDLLEDAAREVGVQVPVLLRLTSGNQFGMDLGDVRAILRERSASPHVHICGIQYFSGTQKRSAKRVRRELEKLGRLVPELETECGVQIEELEYGPGIPIDYCEADRTKLKEDDDAFLGGLAEALEGMSFSDPITLEMGRGITATCGTYATRVVDTKCNKGNHYAITDGGKHQLVYYGQSLALRSPVAYALPERGGEVHPWTVCGALCTAGDTLLTGVDLPDLQVGDTIVFPNAGAYSMTEGMSLFLSRDLPRVYLRGASGTIRLARDRFETSALNTPMVSNDFG